MIEAIKSDLIAQKLKKAVRKALQFPAKQPQDYSDEIEFWHTCALLGYINIAAGKVHPADAKDARKCLRFADRKCRELGYDPSTLFPHEAIRLLQKNREEKFRRQARCLNRAMSRLSVIQEFHGVSALENTTIAVRNHEIPYYHFYAGSFLFPTPDDKLRLVNAKKPTLDLFAGILGAIPGAAYCFGNDERNSSRAEFFEVANLSTWFKCLEDKDVSSRTVLNFWFYPTFPTDRRGMEEDCLFFTVSIDEKV